MKQLPLFLCMLITAAAAATPAWAQNADVSGRRLAASFLPVDGLPSTASSSPSIRVLIARQSGPLQVADVLGGTRAADDQGPPHVAVEYSDAYNTRARIHRIASFATLPLFAAEGYLGESLYNNPTSGKKSAHLAVATAIGGLFALNSVTGVWNLLEARKDPNRRTRRWVHGLLLLAADAGFLATAMTGPGGEHRFGTTTTTATNAGTHRAIAFTSITLATAGYLTMLIGGH